MDGRQSILCNRVTCIYNDKDGECTKDCITLDDESRCEDAEE